ncbi:MAG: Striated muscle preferentially expressed protein kinase [candidate division TM6 bacterium GW2011_GWF2_32_72]|nr:MAG: Striated muscle preferentially expressed protein kinase [candidate division TM6 bacterium GW2011_GWF2_32_72]
MNILQKTIFIFSLIFSFSVIFAPAPLRQPDVSQFGPMGIPDLSPEDMESLAIQAQDMLNQMTPEERAELEQQAMQFIESMPPEEFEQFKGFAGKLDDTMRRISPQMEMPTENVEPEETMLPEQKTTIKKEPVKTKKTSASFIPTEVEEQLINLIEDLLQSIAAIRQKAHSKESTTKQLQPIEINLDSFVYYLNVIKNKKEHLAILNNETFKKLKKQIEKLRDFLDEKEPILQVEEFASKNIDNPYDVLDISQFASSSEIEKAYKKQNEKLAEKNKKFKKEFEEKKLTKKEYDALVKDFENQKNIFEDAYKTLNSPKLRVKLDKSLENKISKKAIEKSKKAYIDIINELKDSFNQEKIIAQLEDVIKKHEPELVKIRKQIEENEKKAKELLKSSPKFKAIADVSSGTGSKGQLQDPFAQYGYNPYYDPYNDYQYKEPYKPYEAKSSSKQPSKQETKKPQQTTVPSEKKAEKEKLETNPEIDLLIDQVSNQLQSLSKPCEEIKLLLEKAMGLSSEEETAKEAFAKLKIYYTSMIPTIAIQEKSKNQKTIAEEKDTTAETQTLTADEKKQVLTQNIFDQDQQIAFIGALKHLNTIYPDLKLNDFADHVKELISDKYQLKEALFPDDKTKLDKKSFFSAMEKIFGDKESLKWSLDKYIDFFDGKETEDDKANEKLATDRAQKIIDSIKNEAKTFSLDEALAVKGFFSASYANLPEKSKSIIISGTNKQIDKFLTSAKNNTEATQSIYNVISTFIKTTKEELDTIIKEGNKYQAQKEQVPLELKERAQFLDNTMINLIPLLKAPLFLSKNDKDTSLHDKINKEFLSLVNQNESLQKAETEQTTSVENVKKMSNAELAPMIKKLGSELGTLTKLMADAMNKTAKLKINASRYVYYKKLSDVLAKSSDVMQNIGAIHSRLEELKQKNYIGISELKEALENNSAAFKSNFKTFSNLSSQILSKTSETANAYGEYLKAEAKAKEEKEKKAAEKAKAKEAREEEKIARERKYEKMSEDYIAEQKAAKEAAAEPNQE